MKTHHKKHSGKVKSRPESLPYITPDNLVKGEYCNREGDRFCYTGWLLHIFIPSDGRRQHVEAYKEFRLATMDKMYATVDKDNMDTPQDRADSFNDCAVELGYPQIPTSEWIALNSHN